MSYPATYERDRLTSPMKHDVDFVFEVSATEFENVFELEASAAQLEQAMNEHAETHKSDGEQKRDKAGALRPERFPSLGFELLVAAGASLEKRISDGRSFNESAIWPECGTLESIRLVEMRIRVGDTINKIDWR